MVLRRPEEHSASQHHNSQRHRPFPLSGVKTLADGSQHTMQLKRDYTYAPVKRMCGGCNTFKPDVKVASRQTVHAAEIFSESAASAGVAVPAGR